MNFFLTAVAAAIVGPTQVNLGTVAQLRVASSNNPQVGTRYSNLGQQSRVSSGNVGDTPAWTSSGYSGNWLTKGKLAGDTAFSVRVTENSTSGAWAWEGASAARGSYLALDTTRDFFGSHTGGTGTSTADIDVDISDDGGSTAVASVAGVILSSENSA